jgi:glycosyltransferase involved in cell wall biosynthesis
MTKRTLVSVLVPAFNEEMNVERAYSEISEIFETLPDHDYEIIFSDNHSTDRTFELLKGIADRDRRVRVIRFSKNVGYQKSLMVAYQSATGDCSVQIDCDLQDSPRHIPEMLRKWREGHQVVYGIRRSLKDRWLVAKLRRTFYWMINALSGDDLPLNAGEYRLVDRRILDELRKIEDATPYPRGLISAMGFSQVGFYYDREARVAGESKFPLKAMLSMAVDGVLNHSLMPLRIASLISLLIGTVMFFIISVYLIGKMVFGQDWPAGFATTTVLLLLSIMLNAMFLGIIGEYVGRIFLQSKRSSFPIIEARLNPPAGEDLLAGRVRDEVAEYRAPEKSGHVR